MKYDELKGKSSTELGKLDRELREELFHLKLKNATAQLEKKSEVRSVRRSIARVQTKLAELGQVDGQKA